METLLKMWVMYDYEHTDKPRMNLRQLHFYQNKPKPAKTDAAVKIL